eukprot:11636878-Alexandrium_andersonii.AAC.1
MDSRPERTAQVAEAAGRLCPLVAPTAEELDQPPPLVRDDDSDGDRRSPGTTAEDAGGPAAREASGPPAPGAHPSRSKLSSVRPG